MEEPENSSVGDLRLPRFYTWLFVGVFVFAVSATVVIDSVYLALGDSSPASFAVDIIIFVLLFLAVLLPSYFLLRRMLLKYLESEMKYRLLAENATDIIWTRDLHLNFTYMSPSVERIRGFTAEEAMAMNLAETVTPESFQRAMTVFAEEWAKEELGDHSYREAALEMEEYKKDGSTIWTETRASFLRDEEGTPVGILGVTREISSRRRMEEELERANAELKGYTHTVSHDLKNPISSISMVLEAVDDSLEEPLTPERLKQAQESIEVGKRGVERAKSLIDDLLMLAEVEQEQKDLELLPVDVGEKVAEVLEEKAADIAERGITVAVDPDLGKVVAFPVHIYQVFANLIRNAIKHNDSEHPHIEVRRLADPARGHRYLVRDNGSGIPAEIISEIFVPFTKGAVTGETGLGLATVERIVQLYKGQITAYNDEGACFDFVLYDAKP